jgi:hypothetical protein
MHSGHKNWVPPIYLDEYVFFNPKRNPAFSYSDTILLLAFHEYRTVGRIMGIINHKYNEAHSLKEARFCFLETYDDYEIAKMLLQYVEEWAQKKDMDILVGPLGFSDKDPQGFLIEGFDQPVVISTNYNFPHMPCFMETAGYSKKIDLVVYKVNVPEHIPEYYMKIYERAVNNQKDLRIIHFNRKSELRPYIRPVFHLVNETFNNIYAFTPMTEKEMDDFASRYMQILDPRFIKVITNKTREVIAFIIGVPHLSEGIRKSRGYLLPFGFYQIIHEQKKARQIDLLLGAVKEKYRNSGVDTMLGVSMLVEANKAGMTCFDSHLELENNLKMRAEMEKLGGKVYKRYRIYKKSIL